MVNVLKKKEVDFSHIPEAESIVNHIYSRYKKGLLNVIRVIGLPGTGKSYACVRLSELVSMKIHGSNDMTPENIVDNLLDLLRFIRRIKRPGEVVVIEEAEVLFPSRRSMSGDNVDATKIFDTLRKKRCIVILNYPINKSVDSHLAALCNLQLETIKIYKKAGVCIIKPIRLQTNPSSGKTYFHRLTDNGREVHRSYIKKPTEALISNYEAKKDSFLNDLYERLEKKHERKHSEAMKELGRVQKRTTARPLTPKELEAYNLVKVQGLTQEEAAKKMGVFQTRVSAILKNVMKKTQITMGNDQEHVLKTAETATN